jgi:tRNA(fMet)-specific endonuclease VapC
MTGSRFLIDTNVVIALFAGEAGVQARLAAATQVFVPSTVIGELHYGARKSGRVAENVRRVQEFAAGITVLPCDAATAAVYGEVKAALHLKGKPIPENDIWIAAIARQHDLTLVSRDEHFNPVDQLRVEKW